VISIQQVNEAYERMLKSDVKYRFSTWLIVSKGNGCEVTTEETQIGPSAIRFNLAQPTAMYDAHDWWLSALKVRSENVVKD
jgi:hypothetical protein